MWGFWCMVKFFSQIRLEEMIWCMVKFSSEIRLEEMFWVQILDRYYRSLKIESK